MQPYYEHNGIAVYYGDCREILPTLHGDVVITDPPYGVQKTDEYDDSEFPTWWIKPAFQAAPRILCMSGNSALITAGNAFGNTYRDCISLYAVNGMTRSKIAFGNWFPAIAAGEWKWKARPNLIKFTVNASEPIDHPSPKPLAAMIKLLEYYTEPEWVIIDCFGGSGTTAVAAQTLGRKCVLIEKEQRFCDVAVRRLRGERLIKTNQGDVLQQSIFTTPSIAI